MRSAQSRELCDEHGVTLPCSGCRADALVSTGRHSVGERGAEVIYLPDLRKLAAGDKEDD